LTKELLNIASKDDKLDLVKILGREVCNTSTEVKKQGNRTKVIVNTHYNKLDDLLLICEDSDIDVVLAAIRQIIFVFCDILPDYKIREEMDTKRDGKATLSKDVRRIREQESYLLESFKKYLQILETFSKFKTIGMSESLSQKYNKLKVEAFE